jgi:CheY-like chemotaxis protein
VVRLVMGAPTPDCLLLDFYLPDMDAPELLPALQSTDGLTGCAVVVSNCLATANRCRKAERNT